MTPVNWTAVSIASLAFVALMVIIWRATHDLDFQWKPQDVRLKVKTVKKPIRGPRRGR